MRNVKDSINIHVEEFVIDIENLIWASVSIDHMSFFTTSPLHREISYAIVNEVSHE